MAAIDSSDSPHAAGEEEEEEDKDATIEDEAVVDVPVPLVQSSELSKQLTPPM